MFVSDLVDAYDSFIKSKLKSGVFNTGGGPENTMSLLELLDILEEITGKKSKISFSSWRPSDQKVYISDIRKAQRDLNWKPKINPNNGVKMLADWVNQNRSALI